MGKTEELFKNPTAEYRGKPFWSWNGKLEKSELLRQIEVFRQMGMGGYFCHSRIGLETEYLGNEWFDLINSCAEKGASLGNLALRRGPLAVGYRRRNGDKAP